MILLKEWIDNQWTVMKSYQEKENLWIKVMLVKAKNDMVIYLVILRVKWFSHKQRKELWRVVRSLFIKICELWID